MEIKKLDDSQLNEVNGGTNAGEPEMKWCDKCQDTTLHNEKGECMKCTLNMDTARYRF